MTGPRAAAMPRRSSRVSQSRRRSRRTMPRAGERTAPAASRSALRERLALVVIEARLVLVYNLHEPRAAHALGRIDPRRVGDLLRVGVPDDVQRERGRRPGEAEVTQGAVAARDKLVRVLGPRRKGHVVAGADLDLLLADAHRPAAVENVERLLERAVEVERKGGLAGRDLVVPAADPATAGFPAEAAGAEGEAAAVFFHGGDLFDVDDVGVATGGGHGGSSC